MDDDLKLLLLWLGILFLLNVSAAIIGENLPKALDVYERVTKYESQARSSTGAKAPPPAITQQTQASIMNPKEALSLSSDIRILSAKLEATDKRVSDTNQFLSWAFAWLMAITFSPVVLRLFFKEQQTNNNG